MVGNPVLRLDARPEARAVDREALRRHSREGGGRVPSDDALQLAGIEPILDEGAPEIGGRNAPPLLHALDQQWPGRDGLAPPPARLGARGATPRGPPPARR